MVEQFVKQLVDGLPPNTKGLTIDYQLNSDKMSKMKNNLDKKNPKDGIVELKIPAEN